MQYGAIYEKARYSCIEASTKSGKTMGCLDWIFFLAAAASAGQNFWWVAPVYAQAKIAYNRMRHSDIRESCRFNDTDLVVTLPNGARI